MPKLAPTVALVLLGACVTGDENPLYDPDRDPAELVPPIEIDGIGSLPPRLPPAFENQRPIPGIDHATTEEDTPVKLSVSGLLANDRDPENGRIIFLRLGVEDGGTAQLEGDQVVFVPDPDFFGTARFDYVISDGRLAATGRVWIEVAPVNDPPLARASRVDLQADDASVFHLDAGDVDGDPLAVEVVRGPLHGGLFEDGNKYQYTPTPGWSGVDHLSYRVGDGTGWSDLVTVDLVVAPPPMVCGDGRLGVTPATAIDVTWLAVSCTGGGDLILGIDYDPVSVVAAASGDCTCTPGVRTVTLTDPLVLAHVGANPVFTVAARDARLAWAVVTVHQGDKATDVVVFDEGGGDDAARRTDNVCFAWSRADVQADVAARFSEVCDDGNLADGDGCSATCGLE